MKLFLLIIVLLAIENFGFGQPTAPQLIKKNETTSVKYQAKTGTCWAYSTTSLIESEYIRKTNEILDLSEMFTVRNIFIEKAKRYILGLGTTPFQAGGIGENVLYAIMKYGAIPEEFYPSKKIIENSDASDIQLDVILRKYLENVLRQNPISETWLDNFILKLDSSLGMPPKSFSWEGREYSPLSFANKILKLNSDDYVTITSFTHQPFYKYINLEIPDNYLINPKYFNLPIEMLIQTTEMAISKGYTAVIDLDMTNNGWNCDRFGYALNLNHRPQNISDGDMQEDTANQQIRQKLFETLVTQDDHLIHLIGLAKSAKGKKFFILKDSYKDPSGKHYATFGGFDYISENYFVINTISILLPKAALSDTLLKLIE